MLGIYSDITLLKLLPHIPGTNEHDRIGCSASVDVFSIDLSTRDRIRWFLITSLSFGQSNGP